MGLCLALCDLSGYVRRFRLGCLACEGNVTDNERLPNRDVHLLLVHSLLFSLRKGTAAGKEV